MDLLRLKDKFNRWRDSGILLGAARGEFGEDAISVHKFGFNPDVDSIPETVWDEGGLYSWQDSASLVDIVSSSPDDTDLGTGAQTVTIYGLDKDYNLVYETVVMTGTTPSRTTNEYLRIYRLRIEPLVAGGVTIPGQNPAIGKITATFVLTGDTGAVIQIGNNQTLMCIYTVPAGYTAIVTHMALGTARNEEAEIKWFTRPENGVFNVGYITFVAESVAQRPFNLPIRIAEKTDIEARARNTNLNVEVSASFDFVLIRNL